MRDERRHIQSFNNAAHDGGMFFFTSTPLKGWPCLAPVFFAHTAALMEIQASRMRARLGPAGEPIPLLEQNRGAWDQLLIRRGFAALLRAERLGACSPGPYMVQAAIAACHARAQCAAETDWERIVALYELLSALTPTPVVELNRAVAVAMAFGPAAGPRTGSRYLLTARPELRGYHLLPSVRGDLLARLGRHQEARAEFERAASLARNARERAVLLGRAAACPPGKGPPDG